MNILKEILSAEVFPAVGCTEPVACAYAAAVAAERLGEPVTHVDLRVDTGTFKNGAAVIVPGANQGKGNRLAGAMGAVLARPQRRLELLGDVTVDMLAEAHALINAGAVAYGALEGATDLRIEATVRGETHTARCVLDHGHTRIERIERDGETLHQCDRQDQPTDDGEYRETLRAMSLTEMLEAAVTLDDDDRTFLRAGVAMNLAMVQRGADVRRAAWQLRHMHEMGLLGNDVFYRVKTSVATAVDARMAGVAEPVMTSGGSGNQGLLAVLTPVLVGRERGVDESRLIESIAIAHVLNAYVKCHLGQLSAICGCAIAAAIAAAAAIVYQHAGIDIPKITHAINNVVGDLSGLICDGAKPGCSAKAVSSVDTAMRSAFMAVEGFGLSTDDGVLGHSAVDSIANLGRITFEGMARMDHTVVDILARKSGQSRREKPAGSK